MTAAPCATAPTYFGGQPANASLRRSMQRCAKRRKRPWHDIGCGEVKLDSAELLEEQEDSAMVAWNSEVEELYRMLAIGDLDVASAASSAACLPLQIWWDRWLWRNDPMQDTSAHAPFNRCQLYGLLVCRLLPLSGVKCDAPLSTVVPDSTLCVCDEPVDQMNVRQLSDTLANLRVCWVRTKAWRIAMMKELLACLASRLGTLSMQMLDGQLSNVQDDESYEPVDGGAHIRITRRCVRQNVNLLMVLLRSLYVHSAAVDPDDATQDCPGVQPIMKHHIFAGLDVFPTMSMHWDLPPASVLNYVHDFAGMYNNVSQVVYYCFPDYSKRNPQTQDVRGIANGGLGALYTLPSIMQMYTDVPVVHLDEMLDLMKPSPTHRWLMADENIYLVSKKNIIYRHPNLVRLMHQLHYMQDHPEAY